MIDAKQARGIVEECSVITQQRLAKIGAMIEVEARLGKSTLDLRLVDSALYELIKPPYRNVELNPSQRRIKAELEKLGYRVQTVSYTYTAGGGLGNIDDDAREETGYKIQITW